MSTSEAAAPVSLARRPATLTRANAYPHRYCRVIWTHYGPRKICRYRPGIVITAGATAGITTAIGEIRPETKQAPPSARLLFVAYVWGERVSPNP